MSNNGKKIRFPGPTNRCAVVGSTGSGKTRFGMWLLSVVNWGDMPKVIFDTKGDDLIAAVERAGYAKVIPITGGPPKKPGTYIVRPMPGQENDLEAFLFKCWKQEGIGLYFDEGYMVPSRSKAFQYILTQGRSKHLPCIVLSQRPAWISRFVFTESEFFAVFRLNHVDDRKTVKAFVNTDIVVPPIPYHSLWYDAGQDQADFFKPVPGDQQIIEGFRPKKTSPKRSAL